MSLAWSKLSGSWTTHRINSKLPGPEFSSPLSEKKTKKKKKKSWENDKAVNKTVILLCVCVGGGIRYETVF